MCCRGIHEVVTAKGGIFAQHEQVLNYHVNDIKPEEVPNLDAVTGEL